MSTEDLTPEQLLGVAAASPNKRALFITRTYSHLFAAILGFIALEYVFFKTGIAEMVFAFVMSISWLAVLAAFVIVSWIASRVAHTVESKGAQYAALAAFVLAEALIFVPMLWFAFAISPEIVEKAAGVTLLAFAGLTAIAVITGRDFSFLRSFLMWGGLIALATIVLGLVFGFNLGVYFSMGMIGFAGASILYDTSNILHHYPEDKYVAAALELFASVALMFWYVLRFFLSRE